VAHGEGDYTAAHSLYRQSLAIKQEISDKHGAADTLDALASLAVSEGREEWAAQLWGTTSLLREAIGSRLALNEREERKCEEATARKAVGEARFLAAWERGCALTWEQTVASLRTWIAAGG
jgi:hypothetical protein